MKLFLVSCMLFANSVCAEDWKIDQKTRDECAKIGGCVLTIPDGHLIPVEVLNEMIKQVQRQAFEMGVHEGSSTCKRTNI